MERPEPIKGAIVIKTIFGEIAANEQNFSKPIDTLIHDPDWREAVGLEGGPFCYTPWERDIPF